MILLQPHAFDLNRSSRSYLFISDHKIREGGLGGRNPGGVREGAKEGAGSGISEVAASRRNREITQHCTMFPHRKSAKRRKWGGGTGVKDMGSEEFKSPLSPPPHQSAEH